MAGKKQTIVFDYFFGCEAEQFTFYRIPKALFTNEYFKGLSSDAKILYGLMLDRMALSIKNQWFDQEGRAYIIFTLEQVMASMNCGKDKGVKILAELDTEKGIGLIERVKRGMGKPAIIYVKSFLTKTLPTDNEEKYERQSFTDQDREDVKAKTSEKPKSDILENPSQNFEKVAQDDYGHLQEGQVSHGLERTTMDEKERTSADHAYMDIIKSNIDYALLMQDCGSGDQEYVDELVQLMTEVVSIERESVSIAGVEYPYQTVKGRFLKINSGHIRYILDCLDKNTTKVRNIRAYLLTCLFNAPATINSYYRAEVNHDVYGEPP